MKLHRNNAVLCGLCCLAAMAFNSYSQQSVNDDFAGRTVLSGTNLVILAGNAGATRQPGEPDHANREGGASVWWTWQAPGPGEVTITTEGSTFDTLLGVYTGSALDALSPIASNDDHNELASSRVRFPVDQGVAYSIAVDGYFGATGSIRLTLQFLAEPIPRPPNDNFLNAALLAGFPATVQGSNTLATHEPGEPLHADAPGDASVWWIWRAPVSGPVAASTAGSDFDTLLAVYTGITVSNLVLVAANDDVETGGQVKTSRVEFEAVSGTEYRLAVDGYDGAMGNIVLSLAPGAPQLFNPVLDGAGFHVSLFTVAGHSYSLEYREMFPDSAWTRLPSVAGTDAIQTLLDAAAPVSGRLYRVVVE